MDKYAHPQRSSVGSVLVVILLLVTTLLSIAAYSPTRLTAVPLVAADDATVTNSTASATSTMPLEPTNISTSESSILTSDNSNQSTVVSNSTSMPDSSTISLTSMSYSSTTSNSTVVNASVITTQTSTTTFSASTNSSTSEVIVSNTTTTIVSSTSESSTTLTNSTTTNVITPTNITVANTTISQTTTSHVQSSFRVDRWDWGAWNPMSGLAIWITNTGTEPLDIFSLTITIGGVAAGTYLYPGPAQVCPLNPILPQASCLFISTPSISPAMGSSYAVVIMSSDGTQTSFTASYGGRSNNAHQFRIDAVNWTPTCCDYVLIVHITNTGGTNLDTDQLAASTTLDGRLSSIHAACGIIAPGQQCQLTLHVNTLSSYVIVITDPQTGDQVYLITPG